MAVMVVIIYLTRFLISVLGLVAEKCWISPVFSGGRMDDCIVFDISVLICWKWTTTWLRCMDFEIWTSYLIMDFHHGGRDLWSYFDAVWFILYDLMDTRRTQSLFMFLYYCLMFDLICIVELVLYSLYGEDFRSY